jgi:16S rRNA (adenine1518-N6/adenine1519-N6)-dimethyltransferase
MFQSEVAERLTAKPGTKAYGFLTVVAQRAAKVNLLFRIPPDAFRPRPRVVSALLRFEMREVDSAMRRRRKPSARWSAGSSPPSKTVG